MRALTACSKIRRHNKYFLVGFVAFSLSSLAKNIPHSRVIRSLWLARITRSSTGLAAARVSERRWNSGCPSSSN
ncbi:hypothetical protein B0H12DRAFT_1113771 [Mycena haematopus]|nr:hypothetical protein B0H12DRAFT_1113771 [Mycena haematopus]